MIFISLLFIFLFQCAQVIIPFVLESPSQKKHQEYLETRSEFLNFLFTHELAPSSKDFIVRIGAFKTICKLMKLMSNTGIVDLGVIYLDPSPEQQEFLYSFIEEQVHLPEEPTSDLSLSIANMSMESQETKEQSQSNSL